jgi:hypothetical protein
MLAPMEDIMLGSAVPQRYSNLAFIGLLYFKDCAKFVKVCDKCQRVRNIGRRNEMPMNYSLPIEPFDVGDLILWDHSHHQIPSILTF